MKRLSNNKNDIDINNSLKDLLNINKQFHEKSQELYNYIDDKRFYEQDNTALMRQLLLNSFSNEEIINELIDNYK